MQRTSFIKTIVQKLHLKQKYTIRINTDETKYSYTKPPRDHKHMTSRYFPHFSDTLTLLPFPITSELKAHACWTSDIRSAPSPSPLDSHLQIDKMSKTMIIRPTLNFDKTIKYMTYATSAYSFKYVKSKVYVNKICTYYINEGYSDLLIRF